MKRLTESYLVPLKDDLLYFLAHLRTVRVQNLVYTPEAGWTVKCIDSIHYDVFNLDVGLSELWFGLNHKGILRRTTVPLFSRDIEL